MSTYQKQSKRPKRYQKFETQVPLSSIKFESILPPVFPNKIYRNFDEHAWLNKVTNITQNYTQESTPTIEQPSTDKYQGIKSRRTQSLYSIKTKSGEGYKIRTEKKASPKNKNQYNKWFIPPQKRFIDLHKQSQEYIRQQREDKEHKDKLKQYSKVLLQNNSIQSIIQEIKKNYKREPVFIH